MAVVGINFTKILVEKKQVAKGKINVTNNVSIIDVVETNFSFGASEQSGIKFIFNFSSKYEPEYGDILLSGEVIYVGKEEDNKLIITEWTKNKKIVPKVMSEVLNSVLTKCNIQAIILSQTMNLPSPIPLPKVSNEMPAQTK